MARDFTREYASQSTCEAPPHVLFPQLARIAERFLRERVDAQAPNNEVRDVFLAPYYGWALERLAGAILPDVSAGEAPEIPRYESNRGPGSTAEVDFWTSRDVRR
jgi:type III restriction enzyme